MVRKSVKRCGQGSRAGRQFRYFQSNQHSALASLPRAMSTIALAPSLYGPELPEIVFYDFVAVNRALRAVALCVRCIER